MSPHGVACPFRVLSRNPGSAAFGLALPPCRWLFVEVLARRSPTSRSSLSFPRRPACNQAAILSGGSALLQGFTHTPRRNASRHRPLPWSFFPFSAQGTGSPLSPGVPSPGTFRLQGFTPPCRLTPPRALRVYFTPVALLGFCPSGDSPPKEPRHLIGVRLALLAFSPTKSLTSMVSSVVGAPALRT